MITTENLKAFREDLRIITSELDEMLKVRSEEKLFNNSQDYYNALKTCEYYPQDFFKLRLFDFEVQLRYSQRNKQFFINTESVKHIDFRNLAFDEFLKLNVELFEYGNRQRVYFDREYTFEEITKIFGTFVICMVKYYFSQDKLFSYEL